MEKGGREKKRRREIDRNKEKEIRDKGALRISKSMFLPLVGR